jgi:hypothetical protein
MGVGAESTGAGAEVMHARFLELDVCEAHVEEKVNALETMKLLLTTGSAHEQRLRAGLEQPAEQNRTPLRTVCIAERTSLHGHTKGAATRKRVRSHTPHANGTAPDGVVRDVFPGKRPGNRAHT